MEKNNHFKRNFESFEPWGNQSNLLEETASEFLKQRSQGSKKMRFCKKRYR